MGSSSDKDSFYKEAQALSSKARQVTEPDFHDLAEGVNAAIEALAEGIIKNFDATVRAAATLGATRVDVLRFHGGDLEERSGFPYLTLLKGPRDKDLRALVPSTLLERLRKDLAPFEVYHIWHNRSNINRLVVSWQNEEEEPITSTSVRPPPPPPRDLRHHVPPPTYLNDVIQLALAAKLGAHLE